MDSTMTINVRVIGRQAIAQLNGVNAALNGIGSGNTRGMNQATGFFEMLTGGKLMRAGKQLQWVGRQLTFAFTLPLVAAGKALFEVNQNIDRSFREVAKVYGDGTKFAAEYGRELDGLRNSFRLLSTAFGVHQEDVIDIGAAWASAGSAGAGLAKQTRATLETMIIGSIDAKEATEGLIAIQATWGLSTKTNARGTNELTDALAILNQVENQTGIRMEGLIDVLERSGGSARVAGASIREVAAMAAAISPAAGSAAQAGNSLKSIFSSLVNPTKRVVEALQLIGIEAKSPEWLGKSVTQKLEEVAVKFKDLSSSNQALISSVVAGKYQFNRFSVLMNDIASGTGYYKKALDASSDALKNQLQYEKELRDVLSSNPRRWDIMTNAMRNTMAQAFIPMMPLIMGVMKGFMRLAQWFEKLSDEARGWILLGALFLALIGPVMALVASFAQLFALIGGVGRALGFLGSRVIIPMLTGITTAVAKFGAGLVGMATGTGQGMLAGFTMPAWAIPALFVAMFVALTLIFKKIDIFNSKFVESVANGIGALPKVFVSVFQSIIRIVDRAIEIIREGLSYLNPFARHSPSLVDNVRAGVSTILDEYSKFRTIPALIRSATNALANFNSISAPGRRSLRSAELGELESQVKAADPTSGAGAGVMMNQIFQLEDALPGLAREIATQTAVVNTWERALESANDTLEAAEDRLTAAQEALESMSDQISAAEDALDVFANAPLTGMREYEDQLFENEQAQKRLRLELLRFEQAGVSLDDIKDKYAALNGEIEMLRGRQSELRLAGAGSDVLGVFDDAIGAARAQQTELGAVEKQILDIQDALDSLDLEARFLELTRDITFDPLVRQIEKMLDTSKEMTFDEIIAGIQQQQALLTALQPQYDAIAATVKQEEAAVKAANTARDAVADQLDLEQTKLDGLEQAYSGIVSLINDMESAMRDYADAVDAAKGAKTPEPSLMSELFDAGLDANYEDLGTGDILQPEGDIFDIEAFNKELEAEIQSMLEGLNFNFDPFALLKEQWNNFVEWIKSVWKEALLAAVLLAIAFAFPPAMLVMAIAAWIAVIWAHREKIWKAIMDYVVRPIWEALQWVGTYLKQVWDDHIWPIIQWMIKEIGGPLVDAWNAVVKAIGDAWDWVGEKLSQAWQFIKTLFTESIDAVGGLLETLGGFFTSVWNDVIKPVFNWIWEEVVGRIVPIFEMFGAVVEIVAVTAGRLIMSMWEHFIKPVFTFIYEYIWNNLIVAWNWLKDTVSTVWDSIWSKISTAWAWIKGVLDIAVGFLDGAFTTSWELITGVVQTVWDNIYGTINGAWVLVKAILQGIIDFVGGTFSTIWGLAGSAIESVWRGILTVIGAIWNQIAGIIEGGANFLIGAFNTVADVINKIGDALGIDININHIGKVSIPRMDYSGAGIPSVGTGMPTMPSGNSGRGGGVGGGALHMAKGGVVPVDGGMVQGARAIVGEGSKVWPEYVIPTDPRYRNRAKGLFDSLGNRIGLFEEGGVVEDHHEMGLSITPRLQAQGNFWDDAWNTATDPMAGFNVALGAISKLWGPVKNGATSIVNKIPFTFFQQIGHGVIKEIDKWVTGGEDALAKRQPKVLPMPTQGGVSGSGSWRAVTNYLTQQGIPYKAISTLRPGARTRISGNLSMHALNRAVDLTGPSGQSSSRKAQLEMMPIANAIQKSMGGSLHELIWGGLPEMWPSLGYTNISRGRPHNYKTPYLNEHLNHIHASLARGGRLNIGRRSGGVNLNVSEGRNAEQVQVLPLRGGRDGDGVTLNFYGASLEFPNVRTEEDAEGFLRNLEAIAARRSGT